MPLQGAQRLEQSSTRRWPLLGMRRTSDSLVGLVVQKPLATSTGRSTECRIHITIEDVRRNLENNPRRIVTQQQLETALSLDNVLRFHRPGRSASLFRSDCFAQPDTLSFVSSGLERPLTVL